MTETATRTWAKGDRVTPDPDYPGLPSATLGRTFIVRKVNPKTTTADPDGGGRGAAFPHDAWLEATDENLARTQRIGGAVVSDAPLEFYAVGEIITFRRPPAGFAPEDPFVVIKDDGRDKVNVAPLFGDNDRYWRGPRGGLVKRDREWLAERLMEEV